MPALIETKCPVCKVEISFTQEGTITTCNQCRWIVKLREVSGDQTSVIPMSDLTIRKIMKFITKLNPNF